MYRTSMDSKSQIQFNLYMNSGLIIKSFRNLMMYHMQLVQNDDNDEKIG